MENGSKGRVSDHLIENGLWWEIHQELFFQAAAGVSQAICGNFETGKSLNYLTATITILSMKEPNKLRRSENFKVEESVVKMWKNSSTR